MERVSWILALNNLSAEWFSLNSVEAEEWMQT